jgi:DGQHR domain-containing protein
LDSYLGIQRALSPKRVIEIAQYTQGADATFPTAVILAVPEQCVSLNPMQTGQDTLFKMTLRNIPDTENPDQPILYRQIARVIDGQHRIAGLENYTGPTFELNVSIFVGADISDQASIFSTVNLAQTKVNRSLVYDLGVLENALIDGEIYKLLRCSKDQCRVFARAAFAEFSQGQGADRARQLQKLRDAGAIAA